MPDLQVASDLEALSHQVAGHLVALVPAAVAARGRCALALSGGNTPRRLYELLAGPPYRGQIPWPQIEIFLGDERLVPLDDPASNFRMAREALLDHVPLSPQRVHPVPVSLPPPQAAAAYAETIRRVLGPRPRFDVVLLGMGADGHTASLFPGAPEVAERVHLVCATESAHNGVYRVTLTLPAINDARNVLFLVAGADKREVFRRVRLGDPALPAALVHPSGGALRWFVEQAVIER